jgi:hypothetical protein
MARTTINFVALLRVRTLPIWLAALALGALLAGPLMTSITLDLYWIDHVPGAARYFCPESGKIAPRYFAPRSSRPQTPLACLDGQGRRMDTFLPDGTRDSTPPIHRQMIFTIWAVWTLLLLPFTYPLMWAVFHAKWRDVRRRR